MRLMRLVNFTDGSPIAVSPAHVVAVMKGQVGATEIHVLAAQEPIAAKGTYEMVVKEWHDALAGVSASQTREDNDEDGPDGEGDGVTLHRIARRDNPWEVRYKGVELNRFGTEQMAYDFMDVIGKYRRGE